MKTYFFGFLLVLFVSIAGAQSTFAQQSPSGDPARVTIDGPVTVRIENPRRVGSSGPSVRKEAATRAARDAQLERELAEHRQQQQTHNETTDSRLSSIESEIKLLELKGVSPNDPQIVALREEAQSLRAEIQKLQVSDQSDSDWRWILGFAVAIALMLAILALILRGRNASNTTTTLPNHKGMLIVVGENETKDLKVSYKNPKNSRRATAQTTSDPAPTAPSDPGTSVSTGTGGNPYAPPQSLRTSRDPDPPTGGSGSAGSGSSGSGSASTRSASGSSSASNKQVEDPNFHIVSLSETEGSSDGGEIVTILGPGVDKADKVNFSGKIECLAKIIEKAKDKIVVITPAHKSETVSVCLQIDGPPQKRAWKAKGYTFVDPPAAAADSSATSKPKASSSAPKPANPPDEGKQDADVPAAPDLKDVEQPVFNPALADALAKADLVDGGKSKSKGPKAPDLKDVVKK